MSDLTLFHGIAVVIDDEIHDQEASVVEIRNEIEAAGCHVVPLAAIPSDASVSNLREVAFFVLDWKLYGTALKEIGGGETVVAPAGMVEANEESIVQFLRALRRCGSLPYSSLLTKMSTTSRTGFDSMRICTTKRTHPTSW
jgi:hypothetical protein